MPFLTSRDVTTNTILAASFIGIIAVAGMLGTGWILYGWNPEPIDEYYLTTGLWNLLGRWSLGVGASILLLEIPLSYGSYVITMGVVAAPFVLAIFYECVHYADRTPHNLLPFDLLACALLSALVHMPSAFGRAIFVLSRRLARRGSQ